jgi:hypothetical protein
MTLVRLIKTCLNETYSKVHIGKHLSYCFPIQNGLKQGDALSPLILKFALAYAVKTVRRLNSGNACYHSPAPSVFSSAVEKYKH